MAGIVVYAYCDRTRRKFFNLHVSSNSQIAGLRAVIATSLAIVVLFLFLSLSPVDVWAYLPRATYATQLPYRLLAFVALFSAVRQLPAFSPVIASFGIGVPERSLRTVTRPFDRRRDPAGRSWTEEGPPSATGDRFADGRRRYQPWDALRRNPPSCSETGGRSSRLHTPP